MRCVLRDVAIAPKKLVLSANYVRGKNLEYVLNNCKFYNTKAFRLILKATKSARFNLLNEYKKNGRELQDSDFAVDVQVGRGGNNAKRYMPKAKGSFGIVTKRKSHISVTLKEVANGK